MQVEWTPEYFANGILVHNCDEVAAWRYYDAWTNLQFGLRLGSRARAICTTTPKPRTASKVFAAILDSPSTVITRARTTDNARNLDAATIAELEARYGGTRLGRQELEGEIVEGVEGALWTPEMIEQAWRRREPTELGYHQNKMARVVVAVDPATTSGEDSDETGIVVAGLGLDGRGHVLEDLSCRLSPDGWARRVVSAYKRHGADRIIAERNQGGDMVAANIRTVDASLSIRTIHAKRGKVTRAEPVAALYEQGRVSHVGGFGKLEDQMTSFAPGQFSSSPDRVDALVYALTELMLGRGTGEDDDAPLTGGRRRE